jgi:hypothetical protein
VINYCLNQFASFLSSGSLLFSRNHLDDCTSSVVSEQIFDMRVNKQKRKLLFQASVLETIIVIFRDLEVFTAMRMTIMFFWVLASCTLVCRCQRFGETYWRHYWKNILSLVGYSETLLSIDESTRRKNSE